jgi:hypothetical protein
MGRTHCTKFLDFIFINSKSALIDIALVAIALVANALVANAQIAIALVPAPSTLLISSFHPNFCWN